MRAQVLEAFNAPYVFKENVPKPELTNPKDVLVRVLAASYCHTDAVYATGAMPPATVPRIGCHEFAGEICAHGDEVSLELREKLPIGTRVGVPVRAYHPCGNCYECVNNGDESDVGYSVLCPSAGRLGLSVDGGFQDYVCVDPQQVEPIPHPLTPIETAPLMCAGLTIYAAIAAVKKQTKARGISCKSLAIVGAGGGLGHLGIQFAIEMGFDKVLAIDAADGPMALIQEIQTPQTRPKIIAVDARTHNASEVIRLHFPKEHRRIDEQIGADAVIILTESQRAFDYGLQLLRNHGVCCVLSFPEPGFLFKPSDLIFRDLSLIGSLVGTRKQLAAMMRLAAAKGIRAHVRQFRLEDLNDLVKEYRRGIGGKLVIDMMSRG